MKIDFFLPGKTTDNISFESFNETFSETRRPGEVTAKDGYFLFWG